jgi:ornithine carbamoyltransferase
MTAAPVAAAGTRHLLRLADLTAEELRELLDLSAAMREHPYEWGGRLQGRTLAAVFEKPSTRTRVSFAEAAWRLGMLPQTLGRDELQLGRGETLADTARTLSAYCAAIAIRTYAQSTVEELAAAASVPVINALTDDHHPCQALADLLTVRDRCGGLGGVRLAFVGDGTNVANSLVEAGELTGLRVTVASPHGYEPLGAGADVVDDPRAAVHGADVVYTDVWASMGEEDERGSRLRDLEPYRVTPELLALAAPGAVFMHCLPAHRGEEVVDAVIDGPQSAVWEQAANRLPTEQALLLTLVERSERERPT